MISVVIPAHNAACTLDECLQAVSCSDYAEYEVIVVDDASTDDTRQMASQHDCRVVHSQQNVGTARAKNLGASEARGDIILFTDADILLQPDTLGLVAENLKDPTVAGVKLCSCYIHYIYIISLIFTLISCCMYVEEIQVIMIIEN